MWKPLAIARVVRAARVLVVVISFVGATDAWAGPRRIRVNTTDDTVDIDPGDGICADANGMRSLRAAVQEANASGEPYEIVLTRGELYPVRIDGGGEDEAATGDLDVTGDVTVVGPGAQISGRTEAFERLLDVHTGGRLRLVGLELSAGVSTGNGGTIRNRGELELERVHTLRSSAIGPESDGGTIFNEGGTVTITRSVIDDGNATRAGGGVACVGGTLVAERSEFYLCNAAVGGGIYADATSEVTLWRCRLIANYASSSGGGLWTASAHATVDRCAIFNNHGAGGDPGDGGGGMLVDAGALTVTRSHLANNDALGRSAAGAGGAVQVRAGIVELRGCRIRRNLAYRTGGGVSASGGSVLITDCRLADGRVSNPLGQEGGGGGGVHASGDASVSVERSRITGNVVGHYGGGVLCSGAASLTVQDTTIRRNRASVSYAGYGGGGCAVEGGILTIDNCRVVANRTWAEEGMGGGVLSIAGDLVLRGSTVDRNVSSAGGGAAVLPGTSSTFSSVRIMNNRASSAQGDGGGLHVAGDAVVEVDGGRISGNQARNDGGGIWVSDEGHVEVSGARLRGNRARVGRAVFNSGGEVTVNGVPVPPRTDRD